MLATSIKNTILVFLLILILHFLIKNALFDRRVGTIRRVESFENSATQLAEEKRTEVAAAPSPIKEEPAPVVTPVVEACANDTNKCKDEEDELYRFVYGDDAPHDVKTTDSELAQYFTGLDVTRDIEKKIKESMKCVSVPRTSSDITMPQSTTCDPALQQSKPDTKGIKQNCELPQGLPVMMLNEYDNESSMNGGALYDNLAAFDNLASNFENYECIKN